MEHSLSLRLYLACHPNNEKSPPPQDEGDGLLTEQSCVARISKSSLLLLDLKDGAALQLPRASVAGGLQLIEVAALCRRGATDGLDADGWALSSS